MTLTRLLLKNGVLHKVVSTQNLSLEEKSKEVREIPVQAVPVGEPVILRWSAGQKLNYETEINKFKGHKIVPENANAYVLGKDDNWQDGYFHHPLQFYHLIR
ncbi:MAG: hypothetical protein KC550_00200 [Nanoarchaeota archaeon]|nr:hypothetical protein [Nanoarchaeota archaeon]